MCELYANMVKLDYWSLDMALDTVTTYYMMTKHDSLDALTAHRSIYYEDTERQLLTTIRNNKGFEYVPVYQELPVDSEGKAYVPDGTDLTGWLDSGKSKINPTVFIIWCRENNIPRPYAFDAYADGIDLGTSNVDESAKIDFDSLFPEYKGLKLIDLTNEKFTEIKRSYGLLKTEAEKYNKSVAIAAKIGLLFYEKGLTKPATIDAFKSEYSKHFAGIPQWLVEIIYESLPGEFTSLEGDNAKRAGTVDDETIDMIIETSIAAGLLCSKNEITNVTELESKLARFEFEKLPTDYMKNISGACKRVKKQYSKAII